MRIVTRSIPAVLLILSLTSGVIAQEEDYGGFLQRSGIEAYRNYAEYSYHNYRSILRVDPRYDFFGDFLAEGFRAFRLDHQRPGRSLVSKDGVYQGIFSNLLVARNSYGRFNLALTIGDEVRTHLTPLTMQRAGLNGLRWEMEFANHKLTLLSSRGFDDAGFPSFPVFSTPINADDEVLALSITGEYDSQVPIEIEEDNPVYTFGGHWGDAGWGGAHPRNDLSQPAAGQHRRFARRQLPRRQRTLSPDAAPPETDAAHHRRFSRHYRPRRHRVSHLSGGGSLGGGEETLRSTDPRSPHYDPSLEPQISGVPRLVDRWNVRGAEELIISFELPEGSTSRRARFIVAAANDYRIAAAQEHIFYRTLSSRTTPFMTLRRASGE